MSDLPPQPTFTRLSLACLATLLSACTSLPPATETRPTPPVAAPSEPAAAMLPALQPLDLPAVPPPAEPAPKALVEDSLQPGVNVDLDDNDARADLWARLRKGFAMPDLDNELVGKAERWYGGRPDYVARMTERGSRYLYHIVVEVEKRGMPLELALLPFIESAFNPHAVSSAKASGMWQFMPATGRDFDLKQNLFRDDRRDVLASTRAALDYLGRLHQMFGDWHLALAAYNWGQGNVQKAVARNQRAGLPTDYESLRMPEETRYYVPKLQAVKNIVLRPEAFALALPEVANHPYFLSVALDRDIDVVLAARLAGMSPEAFKQFNPQANKPVLLAAASDQLLLPYDNAGTFVRNLAGHRGQLASWTAWRVPKTMKPAEAAKRVGLSEAELREVNKIPPRMLVKSGSTLLVPRSGRLDHDVSEQVADNAALNLAPDLPPQRRLSVKARKGDTLASLARRYKVSSHQLAQWNKLGSSSSASLKIGQRLVVYVPKGSSKSSTTRSAKPAKASRPAVAKGGSSSKTARSARVK